MQPLGCHIFSSNVFQASHSCPKQSPTALVLARCLSISGSCIFCHRWAWVSSPTGLGNLSYQPGWIFVALVVLSVFWMEKHLSRRMVFRGCPADPCSLGPLQLGGWLRTDVPWLQRDGFSGPVCPLDVKPLLQKGCSSSWGRTQLQPASWEHNWIRHLTRADVHG